MMRSDAIVSYFAQPTRRVTTVHRLLFRCSAGRYGRRVALGRLGTQFPTDPAAAKPHHHLIWPWCDPTGDTGNGGLLYAPVQVLKDLGVPARFDSRANQALAGLGAIQVIAGFMTRLAKDGAPAFLMHPRCIELSKNGGLVEERESNVLVSAFTTGYVWDEHAAPDTNPNIWRPRKGTRYDDVDEYWLACTSANAAAQKPRKSVIPCSRHGKNVGVHARHRRRDSANSSSLSPESVDYPVPDPASVSVRRVAKSPGETFCNSLVLWSLRMKVISPSVIACPNWSWVRRGDRSAARSGHCRSASTAPLCVW